LKGRKPDKEHIREYMKEQFGLSVEQIDEMLPIFLKTLNGHMDKLEKVLQSGELELIGKAAHTLKGALLNLGLHDSAEHAKEIELKAKSGEVQTDLKTLGSELKATLMEYID